VEREGTSRLLPKLTIPLTTKGFHRSSSFGDHFAMFIVPSSPWAAARRSAILNRKQVIFGRN
jgi:hypothetical protein